MAGEGSDPSLRGARSSSSGYATEADLELIRNEARREMEEAAEYAESSPFPVEADVLSDVFVE